MVKLRKVAMTDHGYLWYNVKRAIGLQLYLKEILLLMNNNRNKKSPKKSGFFFILVGLILPWFFLDLTGLLMKIVAAAFLYYGMDMLTKDNEAFKAGKLAALLMFGARCMVLIAELLFDQNSQLAVIASLVFMVPETFGMILMIQSIAEGSAALESTCGIYLNAEGIKKNAKWYGIAAITVLMGTVFATFGMALFSLVFLIASLCTLIFLIMYIKKIWDAGKTYEKWKDSGEVPVTFTVKEDIVSDHGSEANGVFMAMPGDVEEEDSNVKTIYLAGGCFWGAEKYLGLVPGVVDTNVGYANGRTENPSYEDVKYHQSGHAETVRVKYDETKISLERLLEKYFEAIDPVSVNKQGEDEGIQYRTGIYYTDKADLTAINKVYEQIAEANEKPLAVEVLPLVHYYEAEEYHQKYLDKNPQGYCHLDGCMFERAKEI